jgi:hypothetical protein
MHVDLAEQSMRQKAWCAMGLGFNQSHTRFIARRLNSKKKHRP